MDTTVQQVVSEVVASQLGHLSRVGRVRIVSIVVNEYVGYLALVFY